VKPTATAVVRVQDDHAEVTLLTFNGDPTPAEREALQELVDVLVAAAVSVGDIDDTITFNIGPLNFS
jgi:hypothetical protein